MATTKKIKSYTFTLLFGGLLMIGVLTVTPSRIIFKDIKVFELNDKEKIEKFDTAYSQIIGADEISEIKKLEVNKHGKNKILTSSSATLLGFSRGIVIYDIFSAINNNNASINQIRAPPT